MQMRDVVELAGKHHLLDGSTQRLFDPAAHGIHVSELVSCCWRGFHCAYRVGDDGRLSLTGLTVFVARPEDAKPLGSCRPRPARVLDDAYDYEGLSLPLPPFDGALIVGGWPYRELIFLDGELQRVRRRWSMPLELSAT